MGEKEETRLELSEGEKSERRERKTTSLQGTHSYHSILEQNRFKEIRQNKEAHREKDIFEQTNKQTPNH